MTRPSPAILTLAGVVFVDILGLAIIIPSLPYVVRDFGAGGLQLGLILTAYSLAQAVAAPVLGRLSDRYGRRPVLLLALAGSAVSLALAGLAESVPALVVARCVAGLCGGSIGVAYAFAADLTPPAGRTAAMSWIGTGVGLAFTVGPAAGAVLAPRGFAAVCAVAAAIVAANLVAAWFVLPRSAAPGGVATASGRGPRWPRPGWAVTVLVLAGGVTTLSFVSMETTIALLTDDRFGFGATQIGWLLAAAGAAMTAVQLGVAAGLAARWPDHAVAVAACALGAVSLAVVPLAARAGTVAAVLVLSAAYGVLGVVLMSLVSQAGPMSAVGARVGAAQSANAAGRAIGPLAAGALYDVRAGSPYALTAGLLAAVAALLALRRRPSRTADGPRTGRPGA